jgi:hypothetical protein
MTIFNKIKWLLAIILVFFLVLSTNLVDRQNFRIVEDAMQRIYDDRLVAQDVLFHLTKATWEKERGLMSDATTDQANVNARIGELLDRFEATELTSREEKTFARLRQQFTRLKSQESALSGVESGDEVIAQDLAEIRTTLNDLSEIQLVEGGRQLQISKKAIGSADLFTQLEIGMLIFMAIVIQAIILYNPKPKES